MHLKKKLPLSLLALLPMAASAQSDVYVAPGATVYIAGKAAFYGNVVNNGSMGTFSGDTVTFYGTNWVNGTGATYPVNGTGGTFAFVQPRPVLGGSTTQTLDGAYSTGTSTSFPRLNINNTNNVSLVNSSTRVSEALSFTNGKVVLNTNDLILGSTGGNGGAGTILGYNQNSYAVTNNAIGHLVKETYSGAFTFPVGKDANSYSPAKITNNVANGMHVNVRDYAGSVSAPRTTNDGIDRTWNIYADNASGSSTIDLQHDTTSNQASFRNTSNFVTRFVGTTPNNAGDQTSFDSWERNNTAAGVAPGTLTTGAAIATAAERDRLYTTFATSRTANSAYYTKASGPLCLKVRAYLDGALMDNGGAIASDGRPLMRDNLRNQPITGENYIPVQDPYEFATPYVDFTAAYNKVAPQTNTYPQFQQVTDSATVFSVSGQNAIVDWVFVELRSRNNMSTVQATRAALLQRDGDIVEVNGQSCLSFPNIPLDSYYVAVRHRNHLGAMTKYAQSLGNLETLVDFTVPATPIYDRGVYGGYDYTGLGQKANVIGTYSALWAGDFNADGKVKYDNPDDDISALLFEVLFHPNNTAFNSGFDFGYGYRQGDFDLNGKIKFDTPDDDNALELFQVLFYPQNTGFSAGFDFMLQQLP